MVPRQDTHDSTSLMSVARDSCVLSVVETRERDPHPSRGSSLRQLACVSGCVYRKGVTIMVVIGWTIIAVSVVCLPLNIIMGQYLYAGLNVLAIALTASWLPKHYR